MKVDKPGRNDACPCGSGRKYKKCCQAADDAREAEAERERQAKAAATPAIDPRSLNADHHYGCTDPTHDHGPRKKPVVHDAHGAEEEPDAEERAFAERMDRASYGSQYTKAIVLAETGRFMGRERSTTAWRTTPSRVGTLSVKAIERELQALGVDPSREAFVALAAKHRSAFDLAGEWSAARALPPDDAVFAGLAAHNLWKRYCPERPSTELIEDRVEAGHKLVEAGRAARACEVWAQAWAAVRGWLTPEQRTCEAADACVKSAVTCGDWTLRFAAASVLAARSDASWLPRAIELHEQLLAQFPDEAGWDDDEGDPIDYRCDLQAALIDLLRKTGSTERADALERDLAGRTRRPRAVVDDDEDDDEDDDGESGKLPEGP